MSAQVVWSATHETGDMTEWALNDLGGEFNNGTGTSEASTDQPRSGSYSAKLTIDTTDGLDNGTRLFRWGEAQGALDPDGYYSAWYYIPQLVDATGGDAWWNIFQYKSKVSDLQNDPFWIVNIGNRAGGEMYLYLGDWQTPATYQQTVKDVPVAQWFNIEARYVQADDATGSITIWQDGVKIFDIQNVPTMYTGGPVAWSVNNYSANLVPKAVTIYIDDAQSSLTRMWPSCISSGTISSGTISGC